MSHCEKVSTRVNAWTRLAKIGLTSTNRSASLASSTTNWLDTVESCWCFTAVAAAAAAAAAAGKGIDYAMAVAVRPVTDNYDVSQRAIGFRAMPAAAAAACDLWRPVNDADYRQEDEGKQVARLLNRCRAVRYPTCSVTCRYIAGYGMPSSNRSRFVM